MIYFYLKKGFYKETKIQHKANSKGNEFFNVKKGYLTLKTFCSQEFY